MSYTPNTWVTGDTITAVKLNNMEQGIANAGGGGGAFFVADEDGTLDKTWNEIWTAMQTMPVIVTISTESEIDHYSVSTCVDGSPDFYSVVLSDGTMYGTNSSSGYPEMSG